MKQITQDELNKIIKKHQLWLSGCKSGLRADLNSADLSGSDLSGVNLSDAYLRGANLSDADLSVANLKGANLKGADLRGAKLCDADLSGANLCSANLRDAILKGADLSDPSLWSTIGNSREIKTVQTDIWVVNYTKTHMQIGCQRHKIEEWWDFSNSVISEMDADALDWWKKWKPVLKQIIEVSPAV